MDVPSVGKKLLKRGSYEVRIERLLEPVQASVCFWKIVGGISRQEHERNTARQQFVGKRIYHRAVEIDVENGNVEMFLPGCLQAEFKTREGADRLAAERLQSFLEQHGKKKLILDDEDAFAGEEAARSAMRGGPLCRSAFGSLLSEEWRRSSERRG